MNRMKRGLEIRRNPSLMTPPVEGPGGDFHDDCAHGCEKRRRGALGCFPEVMTGVPQRYVDKVQVGATR
jgi:hypothetical protein